MTQYVNEKDGHTYVETAVEYIQLVESLVEKKLGEMIDKVEAWIDTPGADPERIIAAEIEKIESRYLRKEGVAKHPLRNIDITQYDQIKLGRDNLYELKDSDMKLNRISTYEFSMCVEGRTIVRFEEYLKNKRSERYVQGTSVQKIDKLKWLGSPAEFGYLFTLLSSEGFIKAPTYREGKKSAKRYAERLLQLFEVDGELGSILSVYPKTSGG